MSVEEKKVYCETCGGLGNQLFMIAATLSYAKRTKRSAIFRRKWTGGGTKLAPRSTYWHILFFNLKQIDDDVKANHVYTDLAPGFRDISEFSQQSVQLSGYFQSPKYFKLDEIRDQLFPKHLCVYASSLLPKGQHAFIHIRRGDYKHLTYAHNILPISFYEKASGEFPEHVKFLIFAEAEDAAAISVEFKSSTTLSKRKYSNPPLLLFGHSLYRIIPCYVRI